MIVCLELTSSGVQWRTGLDDVRGVTVIPDVSLLRRGWPVMSLSVIR